MSERKKNYEKSMYYVLTFETNWKYKGFWKSPYWLPFKKESFNRKKIGDHLTFLKITRLPGIQPSF